MRIEWGSMSEVERYCSPEEQVVLLRGRGLHIDDEGIAVDRLRQIGYYRLSGYWYPFRVLQGDRRTDSFVPGSTLDDVLALHSFDERLRTAVLGALGAVELVVRARLGDALGRVDPCAHLRPDLLGPLARDGRDHDEWLRRHHAEVARSRDEFVEHHRASYGGRLPVWAAVEVMDWGALTRLFSFVSPPVQRSVASTFDLRPPQMVSWLRALNVLRNVCAHHGRVFNRVYAKQPRLPRPGGPRRSGRHATLHSRVGRLVR
ncbi:Abi family protein [Curtobacterium sp. MCBA15_004]|uniref:Abi family protein n=1 Tax=unclassified Curtobacterium TaxID=257496 RepID=UPI0008DCCC52|nr:Abi family protein [Curtobacterium sp. MCBA15_004]WIA95363.1 Abi family protein [Curtobacterium sp. MCBA15_004]